MASVRLSASNRHLQALFNEGAVGALTDDELLDRFNTRRGEASEVAFATLVERHAPMVLATCRQLLGNVHDAQDASQAAFLVLARKARSIRNRQAIGGWLHAVALRIASKAKVAAARRRTHEQRGADMVMRRADEPASAELWADLHHQIDRLPDRFRLPIVLCYLEGLTHAQAAQKLGWPVGTVESRLARARERLRERLTARGAMTTVPLLSSSALPEMTPTAAPAAWIEATARAASRFAAGQAATVVASSSVASMTQGMLGTMAFHHVKLAIVFLLAVGVTVTGVMAALRVGAAKAPRVAQRTEQPTAPVAEKPAVAPTTIQVGGRVLDPNGKPLPGARLWLAFQGTDWTWSTRVPQVRAASGPDGRFALIVADNDPEVSRALRMTSGMPDGFGAIHLVATAEGFGPSWTGLAEAKGDVELRLVRDDVPIEGRLINLEGRPLAGIEVRTLMVEDPSNPESLFGAPSGYFQAAKTDADGRFRLTGIGRGRRTVLGIAGPGIQRDAAQVVTGSFPKDRPPHYRGYPVYDAKFEHPCKPGKSISGVVRDLDTGARPGRDHVGFGIRDPCRGNHGPSRPLPARRTLKNTHAAACASARGGDQPYITSERTITEGPGYEPIAMDIEMVRGVVVTGGLIDRANGRPVQAWVAYTALRDNPHWARSPGFRSEGNRYHPNPGWHVPSMADGRFRLVIPPGRGFLVAHIQYQSDKFIPAGVPPKEHPGAPADALSVRYDTVPFELFPQNFPAVHPVDIAPGTESFTCDLTFDSGVVRSGSVLDPEGRPLRALA